MYHATMWFSFVIYIRFTSNVHVDIFSEMIFVVSILLIMTSVLCAGELSVEEEWNKFKVTFACTYKLFHSYD